jgi:cytochrome b
MKTMSASRAETADAPRKVRVWDAPVRVFHWLLVLSFAGAWLSAESERWRLLHVTLGYTMVGLVVFRLVWGLVGTRYARFAQFVRGPAAVAAYVRGLLRGQAAHSVGHNPLGALAIVALLGLALAVGASGWAVYNGVGGESFEPLHEFAATAMLALAAVHLAGVALHSWRFRTNLAGAMVTGMKTARPGDGIHRAWRSLAALMVVAVAGFWWLQWQAAPGPGAAGQAAQGVQTHRDDD